MFPLQLKSTAPINFKKELLPFIKKTYELTETQELEKRLDRYDMLRNAAMKATSPCEASYNAILEYVKELDYLGHLPIGDKKLRLSFKWGHAYNPRSVIEGFDFHLDKISFLYNLAVLQYLEAGRCEVDTEEKIKTCGTIVKKSCATFKTVLEMSRKRLYNVSKDLDDISIDILYNIAENYASELMWMVAIMKGTSPSLVSTLAVHCFEANQMLNGMLSSDTIKREFPKSFPKIAFVKERIFFAEANFLSGVHENENKNFGTALRFFTNAQEEIDSIVKKKMLDGMTPSFVSFASRYLLTRVKKEYETLEKDNRIIYHATVPSSATFPKATKLISVEAAEIPSVSMNDEGDPFSNLIPVRAKALLAEYETKAQEKVAGIKNNNNGFTMQISQQVAALGLPMSLYDVLGAECSAQASSSSAPNGLAEIIDDLRSSGVKGMMTKHADLMKNAEKNRAVIIRLISQINSMYMEDNNKATQYGSKWNSSGFRILYQDVYRELDKLQQKLGQALSTDELLNKKIQAAAPSITVAQQYVVQTQGNETSGSDTPLVRSAREVKRIMDELNQEMNKLKDYNNTLTQKLTTDKPVLDFLGISTSSKKVSPTSPRFLKIVDSNLARYKEEETLSIECQKSVTSMYEKLVAANNEYVAASRSMSPAGTSSGEIKEGLMKYNEIRMGMNNGMAFYTELANRTDQLGAKINSMMKGYNEEARVGERLLMGGAPFVIITGMGVDPNANDGYYDDDGASDLGGSAPSSQPPSAGGSGGQAYQQPPQMPTQPQMQPQAPAPTPTPAPMQSQPTPQQMMPQMPQAPQPQMQPPSQYPPQYHGYPPQPQMGQPMPPQQPQPQYYPGYGQQMQIPPQGYGGPMPPQQQQPPMMPYGGPQMQPQMQPQQRPGYGYSGYPYGYQPPYRP